MDGHTDIRTDRRMNGQTWMDRCRDEWMDRSTEGCEDDGQTGSSSLMFKYLASPDIKLLLD